MKVALIDVDGHNGFPNYALMKLSAYHKMCGDSVEWYSPILSDGIDRCYLSKVFSFTPDYDFAIKADEIVRGGTGYGIMQDLPEEIDSMPPDYSLYPHFDGAIGFLTRGCIRKCPWCVVPEKEGTLRPYRAWEEIKRDGSQLITFLDNNVLACQHGIEQIERMAGQKIKVDFNQGLDARLVNRDVANKLSRLRWKRFIRMSCDTDSMIPVVERAVRYLAEAGIKPYRVFVYLLVRDIPSALKRAEAMRLLGVAPFAQPYIDFSGKKKTTQEQRDFARWVNMKAAFNTCTWDEYRRTATERRKR